MATKKTYLIKENINDVHYKNRIGLKSWIWELFVIDTLVYEKKLMLRICRLKLLQFLYPNVY